jgi:prevent-host-death family protein
MEPPEVAVNEVPESEFDARCLELIGSVSRSGIPIVVTRRGQPLVRVVPAATPAGSLEGTILHQDESLFSTGEEWAACDDAP